MSKNTITEQQKLFINEYIKLRCKNATQAAINAGYSAKTASSQASQLLKNPKVYEFLKQRKSEMEQELREDFIFDALEARKVMYEILSNEYADDANRIRVARDFLDRAGFKPLEKIEADIKNDSLAEIINGAYEKRRELDSHD